MYLHGPIQADEDILKFLRAMIYWDIKAAVLALNEPDPERYKRLVKLVKLNALELGLTVEIINDYAVRMN